MLAEILVWASLVGVCGPDEMAGITPLPSRRGIPENEFYQIVAKPERMDGLVAKLLQTTDLMVVGIADPAQARIEEVQVWGFDRNPQLLATLRFKKSDHTTIVHTPNGEILRAALHRAPELEALFEKYGLLESIKPIEKKIQRRFVQEDVNDEAEFTYPEETPRWRDVYRAIYRRRLNFEIGMETYANGRELKPGEKPIQDGGEGEATEFGGYLPEKHKALAIVQWVPTKAGLSQKVFLNARFRNMDSHFFPDLEDRIQLENRIRWSWLHANPDKLILIEHEAAYRDSVRRQILVLESESDIPRGLPFQRLDPVTFWPLGKLESKARALPK